MNLPNKVTTIMSRNGSKVMLFMIKVIKSIAMLIEIWHFLLDENG